MLKPLITISVAPFAIMMPAALDCLIVGSSSAGAQ
jgi:hypothetical protein